MKLKIKKTNKFKKKSAGRMAVQISGLLVEEAKIFAVMEHRSIAKQIEHWAQLGKCAEDNPDLPLSFIKSILYGLEELKEGKVSEYKFGA